MHPHAKIYLERSKKKFVGKILIRSLFFVFVQQWHSFCVIIIVRKNPARSWASHITTNLSDLF